MTDSHMASNPDNISRLEVYPVLRRVFTERSSGASKGNHQINRFSSIQFYLYRTKSLNDDGIDY